MYTSTKIAELMCDVSELMLTLGPGDTIKTMQRVLLDMAMPKEAANDDKARPAELHPPRQSERHALRVLHGAGNRSPRRIGQARLAYPWRQPEAKPAPSVPEGGAFLEGSVANEAGTRSYKLYVPSCYRGQPLPLVVMLHGCKQDPDDFALGTRMNMVAEEEQCFVLYPAQAASASRPRCWNWFHTQNQQRGQGEPSLIADMTRQVMRDYRIDERKVYVAGLSAGGAMAAIMAATYPDLFAAAAVHSGIACKAADNLYAALMAMKHGASAPAGDGQSAGRSAEPVVPVIVFHGDADIVVHPSNGDLVVRQVLGMPDAEDAPQANATVSHGELPEGRSYTRTIHRDGNGHLLAEQWLIHGSGHAWSGGSDDGSYTDPLGPDATREMMRFFSEQAKPAAPVLNFPPCALSHEKGEAKDGAKDEAKDEAPALACNVNGESHVEPEENS